MRCLLTLALVLTACTGNAPPDPVAVDPPAQPGEPEDPTAASERVGAAPDAVLVDGHGGRAYWEEDGTERSDLSALPLAEALRERYFTAAGTLGGSVLVEDDGSGVSGTLTLDGADVGTWRLDGGTLTLRTPAIGEQVYGITGRSEAGLTFQSAAGELRLSDTAG